MVAVIAVLMPSSQICADLFVATPVKLPSEVIPGDFLKVTWPSAKSAGQFLSVSNRRASWLNDRTAFLGIGAFPTVTVIGRLKYSPGGLFTYPREIFFQKVIKVSLINLTRAIKLRLPAAVCDRLKNFSQTQVGEVFAMLRRLTSPVNGKFNFHQCWHPPLHYMYVTSRFASPRTPPHAKPYYHTGIDLRAPMRTPVHVAASGKVMYIGDNPITGNIVIVDHGGGIYSEYMHLSKFKVTVGEQVNRGQVIGLSGATGRVTGPNLHWELSWKGISISALRFLQVTAPTCGRG